MKKIWIWNHYATGMPQDRGGRHYNFAKYLISQGFDVTIFCADTKFGLKIPEVSGKKLFSSFAVDGITFVFVKTREYERNSMGRLRNMFSFYRNVKRTAREYSKNIGKPDLILASSVHPLTLMAGLKVAKKMVIPCICEIRDLWPESLVAYGYLKRTRLLARYLYRRERQIYERADALIFTMEGGTEYISERAWSKENGGKIDLKKVFYINNGVNLENFDEQASKHLGFRCELFSSTAINLIYAGSIRTVNNLDLIIKPVAAVIDKGTNIRLIIVGDGDKRARLQEKYARYADSIIFTGKFPKEYVPSLLKQSDICIVCSSQVSVCHYGISQNKMFEYLAAGKPILSLVHSPYNPVLQYECGIVTKSQSEEDVARAILNLIQLPSAQKRVMGENSREAAKDFDFRLLTDKLIEVIKTVQ